jgi:hypothetical protein
MKDTARLLEFFLKPLLDADPRKHPKRHLLHALAYVCDRPLWKWFHLHGRSHHVIFLLGCAYLPGLTTACTRR